ncbi:probable 2-oxoglutarate-dependent dioxygenase At5g05600 [Triticum dicoccoides]|uniref:probable 2-oxoglutarate-dependent dioxygenase At5g05600 n=1 Tax=Triticum dicoccoides TaxID=85692 RepID=UPI000E7A7844|nr:probable 2-oxoglutarate-dependent dioxygenase At5g05600 [Triticum dicoccoides]XP_037407212.1 probable 2-oxoglutarate-dependent dioxygenase At5g05600 [Triticum dicoccoides]
MADCMQEWPEPIVRVQAVAESGLAAIPGCYVKPPRDRPAQQHLAAGGDNVLREPSDDSIPVIDLGELLAAGEGRIDGLITEAVAAACRDWGFFQVVNHGVAPELMRAVREAWRGFFRLPISAKQQYANQPRTYEGYGSRVGVQKGGPLDWGDYYFLHLAPEAAKSPDKYWPTNPAICKEVSEEYGREVTRLCEVLMKVLSASLGLEEARFQEAFGGAECGACLRANYYPRCPQPDLTLGLSAHSDPGVLTVLLADEHVRGLQVRRADGEWVTVQPVRDDAFIVNVGDQIQILSNSVYKSVEHRVIVNAKEERISLALFYNPKGDVPIAPAPELVTPDRPSLYPPMTFDEYRVYIRKNGPRGKAQLEGFKGQAVPGTGNK